MITLAWFMMLGTDLLAYMQDAERRSSHALGTVFEALLHAAAPEKRTSAVAMYADWVETRLDASLVVTHVDLAVTPSGEVLCRALIGNGLINCRRRPRATNTAWRHQRRPSVATSARRLASERRC